MPLCNVDDQIAAPASLPLASTFFLLSFSSNVSVAACDVYVTNIAAEVGVKPNTTLGLCQWGSQSPQWEGSRRILSSRNWTLIWPAIVEQGDQFCWKLTCFLSRSQNEDTENMFYTEGNTKDIKREKSNSHNRTWWSAKWVDFSSLLTNRKIFWKRT